jgi:ferric-dicitrate binding protein FerR (iron transport regulator)
MVSIGKLFKRWRRGDDGGRDAEKILDMAGRTKPLISPDTDAQWLRLERALNTTVPGRIRPVPRPVPRFAFALAVVVIVGIGLYVFRVSPPGEERFSTTRGARMHILLPDSSAVVLNHTSEISFNRATFMHSRRVRISGEAFFDVRTGNSPFIVSTDIATVRVVGTEFNVRVRDDAYEVGVTEGTVRVTASRMSVDSTVIVARGHIVGGKRNAFPGIPQSIDFPEYPGWTSGRLVAHRMTVESICREIQDLFDVKTRIDDPALRFVTVTGLFRGSDAREMVSTLSMLTGRQYRYADGTYILY